MSAHRIRRSWVRRISLPIVGAFVAILAMAGTAFAYWATGGSGTGTATTGTLNAPTGVTGAQTAGTGTVTVSWTAPSGTPSVSAYYVLRTNASNTVAACGSSASNPISGVTCADTSVPIGTYTYTVVAVYRSWTSTSAPSGSVNVVAAPQTVHITSTPATPTFGGSYTVTASGGGSNNSITFTGTAGVCTTEAPTTTTSATVSFVGAGSCTLTASQAGSTYYLPGSDTQTFTVAKAAQTITFTSTAPTNATVGGATYTPTATSTSGTAVTLSVDATSSAVCSMNGAGAVSFIATGTCTIDAAVAASANYTAATATQSFAVAQGTVSAPTITSVTPTHLVHGTTTLVTVTGTGFQSGVSVGLSDSKYTVGSVTYVSSTKITVQVTDTYTNSGTNSAALTITNPDHGTATFANAIDNKG